jgi:NDP-sugar pyrophosphorylase family protein
MKKGIATIGLYRKVSEFKKSGIAILDKNKMITSFVEKPSSIVKIKHGLVNTGVYAFNLDILKYIPLGYSDFGRDVFPKLLEKRLSVYGFVFKKGLIAIDTPELYRKAVN